MISSFALTLESLARSSGAICLLPVSAGRWVSPQSGPDILPVMLMVIFGAGASFDSAAAFPLPDPSAGNQNFGNAPGVSARWCGPWRPPLAVNLFRDPELAFGHIVQRYPKLPAILPYLRAPSNGRTVEEE